MSPERTARSRLVSALVAVGAIGTLLVSAAPAAAAPSIDHRGGSAPRVRVAEGTLRGTTIGGAQAFLGVPYAAPPVKDLRFAPPAAPAAWRGVRDATRQAPACLQFQPGGVRETQATSEDCLYLDVYRPQRATRSSELPVVVWIHGGGFTQGTGVIYGGQTLAERTGSVVVSINYRVGALGFLALDSLDAAYPATGSGNWGLLDQVAALRWVNRNARALGGDPANVTVAGQSAGASSVCTLLASPKATGLFQQATIQSAGCGLGERPLVTAQDQGSAFAKQAGCADAATQLACLRSAWAPTLVSAFQTAGGAGPVVGTPTLPKAAMQAIESDSWNKVPVIVGAVAHEGKLFLSATPNLTAADYQKWLSSFGANASKVAARYPLGDYATPFEAEAQAFGDSFLYCGSDRTANLLATKTRVYRYEFDDPQSPTLYGFQPPGVDMSSTHSAELAYLFDFTLGDAPVPAGSRSLANQMKDYWGSFAEDGNPNQAGLPHWPRYRPTTHKALVLRPDVPRVSTTLSSDHHCDFWADPDAAS